MRLLGEIFWNLLATVADDWHLEHTAESSALYSNFPAWDIHQRIWKLLHLWSCSVTTIRTRNWGNFNLVARPCSLLVGLRTKHDCPIMLRAVSCWHNFILKFSLKAAIGTRLLLRVWDWCLLSIHPGILGTPQARGLKPWRLCPQLWKLGTQDQSSWKFDLSSCYLLWHVTSSLPGPYSAFPRSTLTGNSASPSKDPGLAGLEPHLSDLILT